MRAALLAVAALIFALEAAPANAGIPRVASGGCDSTEHRSFKLRVPRQHARARGHVRAVPS